MPAKQPPSSGSSLDLARGVMDEAEVWLDADLLECASALALTIAERCGMFELSYRYGSLMGGAPVEIR